MIDQGNG
jgi:hypothetical protein